MEVLRYNQKSPARVQESRLQILGLLLSYFRRLSKYSSTASSNPAPVIITPQNTISAPYSPLLVPYPPFKLFAPRLRLRRLALMGALKMFPIPLTSSANPYNVTAAARSPPTEKSPQMRMKSDDQPEAKTPKQRPKMMRGRKDVEATPQMRNTDSDERIVVAPPMMCGLNLSLSAPIERRDTTAAAIGECSALSPVFDISTYRSWPPVQPSPGLALGPMPERSSGYTSRVRSTPVLDTHWLPCTPRTGNPSGLVGCRESKDEVGWGHLWGHGCG